MILKGGQKEEKRVILKGGQNRTSDRTHHECFTQEKAELRPDDKISVTRNFANLIVTGLTMTTAESCRHMTNRCATLDSDCVLMEENVTEHDVQNKSACSPSVLPFTHDKFCLALT